MKRIGHLIGVLLLVAVVAGYSFFGQAETRQTPVDTQAEQFVSMEFYPNISNVFIGEFFVLDYWLFESADLPVDNSKICKIGSPADGYITISPSDGKWTAWLTKDSQGNPYFSYEKTPWVKDWIVTKNDSYTLTKVVVPHDEALVSTYTITAYLVPANQPIAGQGVVSQVNVVKPPSLLPEMVSINAGTFMMGSPDEKPVHSVTLSAFYMGIYEITTTQYCVFLNDTGNSDHYDQDSDYYSEGMLIAKSGGTYAPTKGLENRPVGYIRWMDATHYCEWLSAKTGQTYRLPTEAEWEYACRAGTTTNYYWGDTIEFRKVNLETGPTPVGSYPANPWGLYDMHGNIAEWCSDWYGSYSSTAETNPTGPSTGPSRVSRGGAWGSSDDFWRSDNRGVIFSPDLRSIRQGFRVVREAK